ncbi:UNVERIFIED_ORG: enoyl-CoA hydratase [Martelella mediterranea]
MIKSWPHVETERRGAVLIIRLNNEKARNSLTREMRFSLRDIVREIEDDHTVRAVYLTAKGKTFCSGGDLRMLTEASEPWPVHRRFQHAAKLFPPLLQLNRPVVCGVRGMAIGGGMGLALMADLIVVGESAKFGAGFFRLGAVPDCLTLYTLPRTIGLARTRNFIFTNGTWNADEIVDNGLALKVVPDDDVDAEGMALAEQLAAGPAEVMGLAKQLLLKSFESSVDELMAYEGFGQVLAMSSVEFQEGLQALMEKRPSDPMGAAAAAPFNDGLPSADGEK